MRPQPQPGAAAARRKRGGALRANSVAEPSARSGPGPPVRYPQLVFFLPGYLHGSGKNNNASRLNDFRGVDWAMRYVWQAGSTGLGAIAGFALLGLTALPIGGCSQSAGTPSSADAQGALPGSSIRVQGTMPAAPPASDAPTAGVPEVEIAAPGAAPGTVTAVPSAAPDLAWAAAATAQPAVMVTSPTAPAPPIPAAT